MLSLYPAWKQICCLNIEQKNWGAGLAMINGPFSGDDPPSPCIIQSRREISPVPPNSCRSSTATAARLLCLSVRAGWQLLHKRPLSHCRICTVPSDTPLNFSVILPLKSTEVSFVMARVHLPSRAHVSPPPVPEPQVFKERLMAKEEPPVWPFWNSWSTVQYGDFSATLLGLFMLNARYGTGQSPLSVLRVNSVRICPHLLKVYGYRGKRSSITGNHGGAM